MNHGFGYGTGFSRTPLTTKRSPGQGRQVSWRLKRLIITCLLLIGVIPALSGLLLIHSVSEKEMTNSIGRHFMEMAETAAGQIETKVGEKLVTAQWLARLPSVENMLLFPNAGPIEVSNLRKLVMPEFSAPGFVVNLYGGNGEPVFSGKPDRKGRALPNLPKDFASKGLPWVRLIKETHNGNTSYRLSIFTPVKDRGDGHYLGLLYTGYLLQHLFEAVGNIRIGQTGHSNLVSSSGSFLFASQRNMIDHQLAPSMIKQFAKQREGWMIDDEKVYGFTNAFVGYSAVDLSSKRSIHPDSLNAENWYTFTIQNPRETYAPINDFRNRVLLYGLGMALFTTLIGFMAFQLIHNEQKSYDSELIHRATTDSVRLVLKSHQEIAKSSLEEFLALVGEIEQEKTIDKSGKTEKRINKIESGLARICSALEHLSYFAQTHPLEKEPLDLDKLVQESVSLINYLTEKQAIKISIKTAEDRLIVDGDQRLLRLVIMNLVMNAAQAIKADDGLIEISTAPGKKGYAFLQVSDNGVGINKQWIDKIFDPYVTTKKPESRHGLGLATVGGIIEAHGGEISVSSLSNEGTEISILLPLVAD